MIITKVDESRWREAQEFELEASAILAERKDDWNYWWAKAFGEYSIIVGKRFQNVLEVGCGPNTNVRLILPLIDFEHLWLEDPLMNTYIKMDTISSRLGATAHSEPMEELALPDKSINLCICINVLDHVQDAKKCMSEMLRVLASDGIIIIGQDLSNAEDFEKCPDSWQDVGHPIKLDEAFFNQYPLKTLYKNLLPREQGRNPRCHYATLAWIAQKI